MNEETKTEAENSNSEDTKTEDSQVSSVTRLETSRGTFILVGTAHVSQRSVEEVEEVIQAESPRLVCVELDENRYKSLNDESRWKNLDIAQIIRENKVFLLLTSLVLSAYQKRLGAQLESKPGDEMRRAISLAESRNIPFALIDRDISTTLRRAWGRTGLWGRMKLLSVLAGSAFSREELSEDDIESLKTGSALDDMMREMADFLPQVKAVLIDERDEFLALKLWEEAKQNTVVAVVGAGHVPGMKRTLKKLDWQEAQARIAARLQALCEIPRPSFLSKALPWLIVAAILVIFVLGFVTGGVEAGLRRIFYWFVINGGLSALGALVALAHPLTVVAALLAAPVTSMNPTVGVGLFTGLVEFFMRKPRVEDFETLSDSALSFSGFYKNRITRILLVFLFSSIGSAIGTFLALPLILP